MISSPLTTASSTLSMAPAPCRSSGISPTMIPTILPGRRWWKEARHCTAEEIVGVRYSADSVDASDSQILLDLHREDTSKSEDEEIFLGREFALVREGTWLQALRWQQNSNRMENTAVTVAATNLMHDVFPLKIRLSVSAVAESLRVRISQLDNPMEFYRWAFNIFSAENDLLCIWDFSGQTTLFFTDATDSAIGLSELPAQEVLLELEAHGLSGSMDMQGRDDEISMFDSKIDGYSCSDSLGLSGINSDVHSLASTSSSSRSCNSSGMLSLLGLKGLQNLGNTCFMNSAIQCLVHTPKLVDYFLGDFQKEINCENPLGMQGGLALAFGDLLRRIWAPGSTPVAPRLFKSKLAYFAPQFSGYNQHDSQELLVFLLDGLHEDLNRVKHKPYIEIKDAGDRPDEEVGKEYWDNHLARNDSIIVDVCQGQYRSKLVCPFCKKVSVTFDPFMYLTVPLPSTAMRSMTLTVISSDGTTLPSSFTITVPKDGMLKDLMEALTSACSLRNDETLVMAEVFNNNIIRYLDDPTDSLDLIRDEDRIVAYRLPKESEMSFLVEFINERRDFSSKPSQFGVPLLARVADPSFGSDLRKQFLKLVNPLLKQSQDASNAYDDTEHSASTNDDSEMEDAHTPWDTESEAETEDDPYSSNAFQFSLIGSSKVKMNEQLKVSMYEKSYVHVFWPEKMIEKYDINVLGSLPEICKPQLFARRPQESVSLYKCLDAFLREEPLGPEDMWYCPSCKKHQQASKKLDLWRLPEILVIHLKRFSYSWSLKNKLETFVDFPINDLDLSGYLVHSISNFPCKYDLYAISNHYGGLGGGHYTAFIKHGQGRWYEFDDERVSPIRLDEIKTSAAYVLFYQRVPG
ncbi:ubiquitin carboxyl-terminal hydrolase 8-like isoform X2 [Punica granatum]|uniref:Ubiquitin carboxyl-terminal hydrolase n=1 Tax=Punica granatum TaxID=22663 RepID=A0A6P8DYB2_PUNGR|nr:ubiquitin carboxyl-terminal hydrolase 8-like isoform X2 [Punica granatum]